MIDTRADLETLLQGLWRALLRMVPADQAVEARAVADVIHSALWLSQEEIEDIRGEAYRQGAADATADAEREWARRLDAMVRLPTSVEDGVEASLGIARHGVPPPGVVH